MRTSSIQKPRIETTTVLLWKFHLLVIAFIALLLPWADAFVINRKYNPSVQIIPSSSQIEPNIIIKSRSSITRYLSQTTVLKSSTRSNRNKPPKKHSHDKNNKNNKKTKIRDKSIKKLTATNDIMTNHRHRLETAGKIGTKRYADPTMIYIANMDYTTTEEQLKSLLLPYVPTPWDITKIQIVRDWKTGQSKGYAFVRFTQPVYATICIHELHNKEFLGRNISVKSANSKSESPLRQQQEEEKRKLKALRKAQNPPPPPTPPPPKIENPNFLKMLDKDLIVPGMEVFDDDDGEVDGWEVPGSKPPKGFG